MADVEVQTTIFQNPIKVDEAEVAVLRAQGLLVEPVAPPPGTGDEGQGADDQLAGKAAAKETK